MMSHTIEIIKTALKADNSVSASDRARVMATIRNGGSQAPEPARLAEPRLIGRKRRIGLVVRCGWLTAWRKTARWSKESCRDGSARLVSWNRMFWP
jgi:hypothetical protein